MTLIINAFFAKNEILSKNSSQTVQMNAIKLDINHLKMQRYLENKKSLRFIFLKIKKISMSMSQIYELE
jgi:hypothetical protein